ncbi:flagellar basal body rod protein FlgC [Rhizobium sp. LC145]|jgi:flagellar basal-body rod protein FlgC|uniref:flagellar basal body rod protein FlgC n=1 Tax=Rhizobium sp. LC145 TaxID=1120688 RepID=UPI00062A4B6F|nr:flagellar basal body rod protein FlgC [Rhizobium sp. LC145]KKX31980.1 flagellar basal body rod protein FlgC [Rhizobium sp. LC145]TKT58985.1 flagellar basal body rod protein FlgC [Rhizobiaceae bacterium LC148]
MDPLSAASKIAGSGLEAQSTRLRIVSENIANARTTGDTPGADPYRRKTITFGEVMDASRQVDLVGVKKLGVDNSEFHEEFDPNHPAADERGMVKTPNVNLLIEMADMREANRSYDANLQVIKQTRELVASTIDLLKSGQ